VSVPAYDVVVLGGGLTGLAFARLLHAQAAGRRGAPRIAVVEAGRPPPASPPADVGLRVVALSPASRAVLSACGAWEGVPAARLGPYRRMVVWHHAGTPQGPGAITFDAAEQGRAELGWIAENDLLRAALWSACAGRPGLDLLAGVAPTAAGVGPAGAFVALADGRRLEAALLVGADGHESWLRGALGVAAPGRDYGQLALVAHVAGERPHGETAWQRFLADGPLALLPLADGRSSIVWSCGAERARALLAAPDAEFDAALTAASAGVLGALRVGTRRVSFPLSAAHAAQYTGLRFALVGDAAHRVHPLAGQGVNLGFQDAAALAEVLAAHLDGAGADVGDPRALRRYERWRRGANLTTLAAMDALHALFTSRLPGVARAGAAALGAVDRIAPLKRRLADYAMGSRGELPRVVRDARTR
jgi:2-octaprenylphenol hydroxylase